MRSVVVVTVSFAGFCGSSIIVGVFIILLSHDAASRSRYLKFVP
jgi:hypothetical protein